MIPRIDTVGHYRVGDQLTQTLVAGCVATSPMNKPNPLTWVGNKTWCNYSLYYYPISCLIMCLSNHKHASSQKCDKIYSPLLVVMVITLSPLSISSGMMGFARCVSVSLAMLSCLRPLPWQHTASCCYGNHTYLLQDYDTLIVTAQPCVV